MQENRYLTRLNWDFNNYHKFSKCHCASKSYCLGYNEIEEAKIKYYNHPEHEKKHYDSSVSHYLKCLAAGTLVDVYLSNGQSFLMVYFVHLDPQNNCACFLQINEKTVPITVNCAKIDAVRKVNII
ncbi:hypothetical protein MHB42_10520 [Lysinibacillus sp. FSL K6-0232]|uniref:hypothetical protein n=1 Tax=unclassified Lysinibacillus TaxID=2636778 RepID=UPI0030F9A29F